MGFKSSESVRVLAQAGSSLSLLAFLYLVKIVLYTVFSGPGGHAPVLIGQDLVQTGAPSKEELRESFRALRSSPNCSALLGCLNFGLSVREDIGEEGIARCKQNFLQCRDEGLLHHLDNLLEAVDA